VREAVQQGGLAQAFVYCAGMQLVKLMRLASADDACSLIEVNLTARCFSPHVCEQEKPRDGCGVLRDQLCRPFAIRSGIVAYSASKPGLHGLVRGLARQVGPLRVAGIAPNGSMPK